MAFAAPAAGAATRGAAQAATVKAKTRKVVKATKTTGDSTRKTTRNIISNNKRSWEPRSVGGYRRIITALFVLSALIVIYKNSKNEGWSSAQSWRRLGAVWFVYFVFGIASTAGIKVARVCALLGGLITLALLIQNKELLFGATSALRGFGGTANTDQDSGVVDGTAGGGGGGGGGGSWGSGTGTTTTPAASTQPLFVNGQVTDRTKVFLTEANTPANVPTAASNPGGTPGGAKPAVTYALSIAESIYNTLPYSAYNDKVVSGWKISRENVASNRAAGANWPEVKGDFWDATTKTFNLPSIAQNTIYTDKTTGKTLMIKSKA